MEAVEAQALELLPSGEIDRRDIAFPGIKPGEIGTLALRFAAAVLAVFQVRPHPQDAGARLVARGSGEERA